MCAREKERKKCVCVCVCVSMIYMCVCARVRARTHARTRESVCMYISAGATRFFRNLRAQHVFVGKSPVCSG